VTRKALGAAAIVDRKTRKVFQLRVNAAIGTHKGLRRLESDRIMGERMTRDSIIEVLRTLPPDATLDDALEQLAFLLEIERGIAELDAGKGVPHEEVKGSLGELIATGVIRAPLEQRDLFEGWPDIHLPRGAAAQLIDQDREED